MTQRGIQRRNLIGLGPWFWHVNSNCWFLVCLLQNLEKTLKTCCEGIQLQSILSFSVKISEACDKNASTHWSSSLWADWAVTELFWDHSPITAGIKLGSWDAEHLLPPPSKPQATWIQRLVTNVWPTSIDIGERMARNHQATFFQVIFIQNVPTMVAEEKWREWQFGDEEVEDRNPPVVFWYVLDHGTCAGL